MILALKMAVLNVEDLVLVGAVSVAHGWQMIMMAKRVGDFRRKHKISPPTMTGPEDFIRALRAQQNGLEFGVPFEVFLWSAGIFGHQVPAAAIGALYVFSRRQYNNGYIEAAEKRVRPFWVGVRCMQALVALSVCGLVNTTLVRHADIDLVAMLRQRLF